MKINKEFFAKIIEKKHIFEYIFQLCVYIYVIIYMFANIITMISLFANQNVNTLAGFSLFLIALMLVIYGGLIIFRYNNKYNLFYYMLLVQLLF